MKMIVIGIMIQEKICEWMLFIVRGEYKLKLGEFKVWFMFMKLLVEVLSDDNCVLFCVIIEMKLKLILVLVEIIGCKFGNLFCILKMMFCYGIVDLK